jgi:hypothetical protein
MWEISSASADRLFAISNAVLIIGAAMVLIGTIGAIVLSGFREQFSNARLSDNETKTAQAIAESDTAKMGAAEANARALEAQLALERFKAPRGFTPEQELAFKQTVKPFAGQEFSGQVAAGVPDARPLWISIDKLLTAAHWIRVPPWGVAAGDPPAGIPISPNEGVTIFVPTDDVASLTPAATALLSTLTDAGIKTVAVTNAGLQTRAKIIVIEIGIKPQ